MKTNWNECFPASTQHGIFANLYRISLINTQEAGNIYNLVGK